MILITTNPCPPCGGTGWVHGPEDNLQAGKRHTPSGYNRYMCARCRGAGAIQARTEVSAVGIGPGWFTDGALSNDPRAQLGTPLNLTDPLPTAHRHDVAMLAACLGSRLWPPEGA